MTTKAELHQLIDALPENLADEAAQRLFELQDMQQLATTLKRRLSFQQLCELVAWLQDDLDQFQRTLLTAPWDDETVTDEERAAIAEADEAIARGDVFSHEEVMRKLGL